MKKYNNRKAHFPRRCVLSELLLEPDTRGLSTSPTFIRNILRGFCRRRELEDLSWEISYKELRAEQFKRSAIGKRYADEAFILNRAYDMLAEMLEKRKAANRV